MTSGIFQSLYEWFFNQGLRILVILIAGKIIIMLGRKFSRKIVRLCLKQAGTIADKNIDQQRLDTVTHVFTNTGFVVVISVLIMMILSELGFSIAPILAGAGIVGLAVGFGSQSLVKDVVSGLFILIENQYGIGDRVGFGNIGGTTIEGIVKKINLRRTMVESDNGNTHIVPNGSISLVTRIKQ